METGNSYEFRRVKKSQNVTQTKSRCHLSSREISRNKHDNTQRIVGKEWEREQRSAERTHSINWWSGFNVTCSPQIASQLLVLFVDFVETLGGDTW